MTPIERAAEAIHGLSNSDAWSVEHAYIRDEAREDARAGFESINPDELARVIGEATELWQQTCQPGWMPMEEYVARAVKAWLEGEEA